MRLLDLEGNPMTWAELFARAERYYASRECPGTVLPARLVLTNAPTTYYFPDRVSGSCAQRMHGRCSGKMARIAGQSGRNDLIPCPCHCHGRAA